MHFYPLFPHLLPDLGAIRYKRSAKHAVRVATIGAGPAVHFLWYEMELHLRMHRETAVNSERLSY
jgi:hypothetical protein